jgi:hypothetical protein
MKMIRNKYMDMNVDLDMEMEADMDIDMETVTGHEHGYRNSVSPCQANFEIGFWSQFPH